MKFSFGKPNAGLWSTSSNDIATASLRHLLQYLAIGLLILTARSFLHAQGTCQLRLSTSTQTPKIQALWDADNLYWVYQTKLPNNRYDVLIVGDTLVLDSTSFPMLARTDDRPITNWNSVRFDARKIIVAMPLIFASTSVELSAEELIWKAAGHVTLKVAPSGTKTDGLRIVTKKLDLSDAPPVPIDFSTDDWSAYPPNDTDIPPAKHWNRKVSIHSEIVVPPSRLSPVSDDSWLWIRNLTRDQYDTLHGGAEATFSRRPYDIGIGEKGQTVYLEALKSEMLWPSALASKAQRSFTQSPYDSDAETFFTKTLDVPSYIQLFKGNPRHLWASQALLSVYDAAQRHVDLFGHPSEFVPRVKFEVLKSAFESQFSKSEKLGLKSIEKALGDPNASVTAAESANQLDDLGHKRSALRSQLSVLQDESSKLVIAMEADRQEYEAEAANLQGFKARVDQWADDKKKSNEQKKQLGVAVDVIGVAGTTVLTVYAGPAAGAVFAKSWATVGGTVVKHQYGQTITNVSEAVEAVKEGTKQGEAWSEFAKDASGKWKALTDSASQGKTVEEQVRLSIDVINVVNKQVQAISERASVANNVGTNFDLDPEWKAEADSHRAKMEKINTAIVETQMRFASKVQDQKSILEGLQGIDQIEAALNASTPSNPLQAAESQNFYNGLVTSLLTNLGASYSELSRAYNYYVRVSPKPFDFAPVRDGLAALQSRQLESLASDGKDVPLTIVAVSDQIAKVFDGYQASLITMDQDVINARQRVTGGNSLSYQWKYTAAADEDPIKRDFVKEVDSRIRILFAKIKDQKSSTPNQASTVISLPIYMYLDQSPTTPELLQEIYIHHLGTVAPITPDAQIEFSVDHPGYGDEYRENRCYFVNFGDPTASQNILKFPSVLTPRGDADAGKVSEDFYAPFPLRTNYSLEIVVRRIRTDRNFKKWTAPVVQAVDINSKYVR